MESSTWNMIWDIILVIAPYVIGGIISLIGLVLYIFSKQRRLLKFIGVDNNQRRIIVYLSSLLIPRGSALGFDGKPRSYQGITIPIEELSISYPLTKSLAIDIFENVPPFIRNPLKDRFALFRRISIDTNASPMNEKDIDFCTGSIITVGSQGYNIVTNYCVSRNLCQMQITQNGTVIEIIKGRYKGEILRPPSTQHDIAILEKLVDESHQNTTIIIGAGLGVVGTMGAIQYLINHWEDLYKTYEDRGFSLALQFGPIGSQPMEDLLKGSVIRRLPED